MPYSQEYAEWLKPAAKLLREAAALTGNASLKKFLELRAAAFESDDYYASDVAWMDLDAPVEVTIGPYETYEDELFGYKAAFEAFVTVNLPKESAALALYKERLPWLERNLPIPDERQEPEPRHREPDPRGGHGLQRRATPGPACRRSPSTCRTTSGCARPRARRRSCCATPCAPSTTTILIPIAERVLDPAQVKDVSFDAYFNEVLHHELSHGLGPGTITVDGRKTEVRLELKEHFSTLEEAKADVMGVYNILALIERGEMPAACAARWSPPTSPASSAPPASAWTRPTARGSWRSSTTCWKRGRWPWTATASVHAVSEKFPGAHPRPAARHADAPGDAATTRGPRVPRHLRQAAAGDAGRDRPAGGPAGGHPAAVRGGEGKVGSRWGSPFRLLHPQQLHLEDQRGVRRDHPARAARAVAQVGGDGQLALAADLHAGDALRPSRG